MNDRAWKVWAGAFSASFLALETDALLSGGERPTLSVASRGWLGRCPARPRGRACAVVFIAACAWLAVHIVFDALTPRVVCRVMERLSAGRGITHR